MGMWDCCTLNTGFTQLQTAHIRGAVFSSLIKVDFHFNRLISSSMWMLHKAWLTPPVTLHLL